MENVHKRLNWDTGTWRSHIPPLIDTHETHTVTQALE